MGKLSDWGASNHYDIDIACNLLTKYNNEISPAGYLLILQSRIASYLVSPRHG